MEEEGRLPEIPLELRFVRTPEDLTKGLPVELVEDLKKSVLEASPGLRSLIKESGEVPPEETPFDPSVPEQVPDVPKGPIIPDIEVAAEVEKILTDKDVETIMEKCSYHWIKMEGDNPQDWCHYRHNYCMIGNHAFLPDERGMVADVCIRGY